MTQPNELRRIDAEVAVNIFGWHRFESDGDARSSNVICKTCGQHGGGDCKHWIEEWVHCSNQLPRYTAPNSPHALEVLKWCANKVPVEVHGGCVCYRYGHGPGQVKVFAEQTLEVGICKLALALALSKEGV